MSSYRRRIIDRVLDEVIDQLPAIALEGAKGVGKTATAEQRAASVIRLDHPQEAMIVGRNPDEVLRRQRPTFVDEWQLVPQTWDVIRRAVDDGAPGGSFLLAGSSMVPKSARIHSGAARIVRVPMRPLSLFERGLCEIAVGLGDLLSGSRPDVEGTCEVNLGDYAHEIMQSGFPGLRGLSGRALKMQLDGYLDRIVNRQFDTVEQAPRSSRSLRAWLEAYGAATGTNASYEAILNAATAGETQKPASSTVRRYRDYLAQLYLTDPLPAWTPAFTPLKRLSKGVVHHLVDPALAVRITGLSEARLLRGEGGLVQAGETTFLGRLFESLAVQSIRVYAEATDAKVYFLRTYNGRHEVDVIVEGDDGSVVAMEVKLASFVEDSDVVHLKWLESVLGARLSESVVVYAGSRAYRRHDRVLVLPLAMLGP